MELVPLKSGSVTQKNCWNSYLCCGWNFQANEVILHCACMV